MPRTKFERKLDYNPGILASHKIQKDTTIVELVGELRELFPLMKVQVVYLSEEQIPMNQYMIIVKFPPHDKFKHNTFVTVIGTTGGILSLESYDIAKKDGKSKEFFEEFFSSPIILPEYAFNDLITKELGLSLLSSSNGYWKKKDRVDNVVKKMTERAMRSFTENSGRT